MEEFSFLFETSWEVCNKVGGIYTVIKSKLQEVMKQFGQHYCLIGPLLESNPEFEETDDEQANRLRKELSQSGLQAKVGRWRAEGRPLVVLVAYKGFLDQNKLLYQLWEDYSVDSMTGGWDYVEPVMFSTMAGKVIEILSSLMPNLHIMAQFHEWLCGAGLLYIKKRVPRISTIFTTHATVLGRSLASHGIEIYKNLADINVEAEAARLQVTAKHSMERAAAREADCFATVSEITAIEAKYFLGVYPDVITPNGFPVSTIPSYERQPAFFQRNRQRLLEFASSFLGRSFKDEDTFIISTSGRYEFHNKGIDVFLDALGLLAKNQEVLGAKNLLVFLLILTGAVDLSRQVRDRTEKGHFPIYSQICTHPLWDPNNDPIVNTCKRHNLQNNPSDRIAVIFVPLYLNGADGVLNLDYYHTLSGCDLTVYPSYYEPWGYTPLESVAYSVPTVSTDLAGFGRWVLTEKRAGDGIKILSRFDKSYNESVAELRDHILWLINLPAEKHRFLRYEVYRHALQAEWQIFFREYLEAFEVARRECRNRLQGRLKRKIIDLREVEYRGADSQRPRFRKFSVKAAIPDELFRLRELAYNLWWSWNQEAMELFTLINPLLFERMGNNPVALLETVEPERLRELARNESYVQIYKNIIAKLDAYLNQEKVLLDLPENYFAQHPIAYFSMEYGLHECLPIYSGGLGILSGDHLKSASDLNLGLIAIGLLYKNGYFKQGISKNGEQLVEYYVNDFFRMPLQELYQDGEKIIISIEYPGRKVNARVWEARVGRTRLYLFDTDIPENSPADRSITGKLYGGGKQLRIEQEILLGIGGVRLLEKLAVKPSVYHLNEGHSAFLIIERLINTMKNSSLDLETAKEVIKASTVFTTHTPVPAGNETFELALVENYLKNYVESQGLSWNEVSDLGHRTSSDQGPYEMTVLALKNSYKRNGVSQLHGHISRSMWADIWSGFPREEVPIKHITNGVHAATWVTSEIKNLLAKYASLNLNNHLLNKELWQKIDNIPDEILWQTHLALKNKLFSFIKDKVTRHWTREGEDPALLDSFLTSLTSSPLTIGFARRFATYKRATLFLHNKERLRKLLLNPKYPIQFIFAGKAHPNDKAAFNLIKEIVDLSKQEEYLGKIIFLEDYDMRIARRMISGVDVWLNNPRRPLEASGTSGQKAGMNGVINFSVLDGWWDEAYDPQLGWAIGERHEYANPEMQDLADCDFLYDTLENEIIPLYYSRNLHGIPEKWVKMMKNSMKKIIANFNTHRMLAEYTEEMYLPATQKHILLIKNNFAKAREIAQWKKTVRARFASIHINSISLQGIDGDLLNVGDSIQFNLVIHKGQMTSAELKAEVVIFQEKEEELLNFTGDERLALHEMTLIAMEQTAETENEITYQGRFVAQKSGKFNYGIRIMPYHPEVDDITDLNLVFWG